MSVTNLNRPKIIKSAEKSATLDASLQKLQEEAAYLKDVIKYANSIYKDLSSRRADWTLKWLRYKKNTSLTKDDFINSHPETITLQMLNTAREEEYALKQKLSDVLRQQLDIQAMLYNRGASDPTPTGGNALMLKYASPAS